MPALDPITAVSNVVDTVISRVWPDANEEEQRKLDAIKTFVGLDLAQQEVNKAEAEHPSVFVAGWRPFVGWVAAVSMAYAFVGYPLLTWASVSFGNAGPPQLDISELLTVLLTMLGMGSLRTYEGIKGIKRTSWGKK